MENRGALSTIGYPCYLLIYVLKEEDGYMTLLRATKSGKALFMTSLHRLSKDAVRRDREIQRLLRKSI